ncbi:MAG: hypothetical protein QNJ19_02785 [Woeseiaceae bacterium]|nr:hypothetical protein [Woeseiaceae bacterium]
MPDADLPISFERDEPEVSIFQFENVDIEVTRSKGVDKMGPDEDGLYEFYYDFELFEFRSGSRVVHGRAYADQENEASLIAIYEDGERRLMSVSDLQADLGRAAIRYFKNIGKTDIKWLDPDNKVTGYSPIP